MAGFSMTQIIDKLLPGYGMHLMQEPYREPGVLLATLWDGILIQ